jgi:hypothetical protein
MRSLPTDLGRVVVGVIVSLTAAAGFCATLQNPDFETGTLSGWSSVGTPLTIGIDTNNTFNRNSSAHIYGSYSSDTLITNSISQSFAVQKGDYLQWLGFMHWKTHDTDSAAATGYVQAALSGEFGSSSLSWYTTGSWLFFDLRAKLFGIADPGFESGALDQWTVSCDDLIPSVQSAVADSGSYALRLRGTFVGWSWNEVCQFIPLEVGDVIVGHARINVVGLQKAGPWLVAGIKLEEATTNAVKYGIESKIEANAKNTGWVSLSFTSAPIARATTYIYRVMICGYDATNCDVYFDDVNFTKQGDVGSGVSTAQVSVSYIGHSGGLSYTSDVDVYVDSFMVKGSTADIQDPTNILTVLRNEAAAVGTNPLVNVPELKYPYLFYYGSPGFSLDQSFPACVEIGVAGWKFKPMKRYNVTVTATNTISLSGLATNGYGFVEMDQYRYVGVSSAKERGDPAEFMTNAPYFTLGTKDNSSAEFGEGPFPAEHTYVVGTPLANFPRRMSTDGSGGWPSTLHIVFQENFSTNFYNPGLWQKYFCLYGVATNGPACNVKACKIGLSATKYGLSNEVEILSQEIHLGWASEAETRGMIDYPNLTYQDHNEVGLRAGWLHNLLDTGGWYMTPSPRGSATIEPIDLYFQQAGNWTWRAYEEYLFTWPNAASGVRSIFDSDYVDALPGPASYFVGFKIGHENGTNDVGETQYPEVLNIRGCGYYRMTDYDGVMAGSFRPMAADVFGLYAGMEDAPLIPKAYVRMVPRTTMTNEPDNSYAEAYQTIHSKTNEWYIGAIKTQMHFSPSEVSSNGCYFDLEQDTWANKATVVSNHGLLACFSQVSMHWRASSNINDGTEGHDIDCVMLKKSDGEWVTHQVLNPFTNIYQRTLSTFRSNDVVYLQQQDRGKDSYGFATEAPYRRASSFEITMLDDGGLPLSLDVYENSTISEIADNVNITCQIHKDIAEGEKLHYKYRYRTVYAPGVTITSPNESEGGENWSSNSYRVEFYATDGNDEELVSDIYYGNGLDSGWVKINTNGAVSVPTNTHKVSYLWDVSGVPAGAYYIKAMAKRVSGGKSGFDVSNMRLQVGPTYGFAFNSSTNITVITNVVGHVGTNMSFETGTAAGWAFAADDLAMDVTDERANDGEYSARISGTGWTGWSWNSLGQEVRSVAGEVLHVTGRVYIGRLNALCGIKMESTNAVGQTSTGVEFNATSTTGSWLTVDFQRIAPVDGTDRLLLWVAGTDGTGTEVYFDNLSVTSTNTGLVVTNGVRTGYWEGSPAVNVTNHNILSFLVAGTYGLAGAQVCVTDSGNTTNRVTLTNYVDRIVSLRERVDIPWTNFPTIDRTQVKSIFFASPAPSNDVQGSCMRSTWVPLVSRSRILSSPMVDLEGMVHFNPGDTVTNVLTIQNISGSAITGVNVQAVHEYAETRRWLECAPGFEPLWSPYTRSGDRLCGNFEQVWTNQTLNAGSSIVLTNIYTVPLGRRVNHLRNNYEPRDWYFLRNYACRAQLNVAIRRSNGDNVYQNQGVGNYSMDNDYDIDNDGLPDAWEVQFSGTYTGMKARVDSDGDSFNNLKEYIAGTVATNSDSLPLVNSVQYGSGGSATIWINTLTNRVYWVEWSASLTNAIWLPVNTNLVVGDGGLKSLVDSDSPLLTNRYYKMGVKFSDGGWPL